MAFDHHALAGSEAFGDDDLVLIGVERLNPADLDDTAKVTLKKQAEWLAQYPRYKIKIEGFADDRGNEDQDRLLGLRRADAARAYLASIGVAPPRMRTKTFGSLKERLANACSDASCRAQNRRVVTVLEQETGI